MNHAACLLTSPDIIHNGRQTTPSLVGRVETRVLRVVYLVCYIIRASSTSNTMGEPAWLAPIERAVGSKVTSSSEEEQSLTEWHHLITDSLVCIQCPMRCAS